MSEDRRSQDAYIMQHLLAAAGLITLGAALALCPPLFVPVGLVIAVVTLKLQR